MLAMPGIPSSGACRPMPMFCTGREDCSVLLSPLAVMHSGAMSQASMWIDAILEFSPSPSIDVFPPSKSAITKLLCGVTRVLIRTVTRISP